VCVFPMQPLTFTLSGIFITVLSKMTIFNNCFIVHIFISILNTILLHLHCKRSSIIPLETFIILHRPFTMPPQMECTFWQAFQMTASFIKCNLHSIFLGSPSIAIATTSACQSQISQVVCTFRYHIWPEHVLPYQPEEP